MKLKEGQMCEFLIKRRQTRSNKNRIELEGQIKMEEMCF